MLRQHRRRKPVATLGVYEVPDPRRCGIVSLRQDGMIEQFVEKPDTPISNLAFSGLMIGTPAMLEAIPDQVPADIGFHVLPKLGGKMLAFPIQDYLLDVGTLENYQKAQQRQAFQFALQDRQRAAGSPHSAGSVQGGLGGDAVSTSCQKNPQEFRRFERVQHALAEEVIPQSTEFCRCKSLFHHRLPPQPAHL
jgi:NDP-sugar pyrophosphorylase family protein